MSTHAIPTTPQCPGVSLRDWLCFQLNDERSAEERSARLQAERTQRAGIAASMKKMEEMEKEMSRLRAALSETQPVVA